MKQFCSVFPDGFLENFTEVRSMFETFLAQRICSYVGELERVKSSKKDSNKKNDQVRRRSDAIIFEILR